MEQGGDGDNNKVITTSTEEGDGAPVPAPVPHKVLTQLLTHLLTLSSHNY